VVELNLKEPQEYVRPECQQCADFSTELADISFGGVELMKMDYCRLVRLFEAGRYSKEFGLF